MRKRKPIMGLLLILMAAGGLVYWEAVGREEYTTERVLVAAAEIEAGAVITVNMLAEQRLPESALCEGALSASEAPQLSGKRAKQQIPKNQQLSAVYFEDADAEAARPGYRIKAEWIDNRSSALEAGGNVDVYRGDGSEYLGRYEILCISEAEGDGSDPEYGVEIRCGLADYARIYREAAVSGAALLLVQDVGLPAELPEELPEEMPQTQAADRPASEKSRQEGEQIQ